MVNVYFGKTNDDCLSALIEKVRGMKGGHHIFIVPDRMSMLCEKKIVETLKISSTINIEVLILPMLASRILRGKAAISKAASCMILQKILRQNIGRLKCFNKNQDSDLAQSIYETISKFKSCKVDFNDIYVPSKDKLLEDKLSDIALLYGEYQKELVSRNLFDNFDRLTLLESEIKKSDLVKSSCFYISHFDGFTLQGYSIINAIAKTAKEINIGVPHTDNLKNEHIYDETYSQNIFKFFPKANVIEAKENKNGEFKLLQDNLFSFNSLVKTDSSNISLFEGKDFEEEVIYCASKIKDLIMHEGYNFSDFFVAVPNLDGRYDLIKQIFEDYDFRFFIDVSYKFSDSIVARFVKMCYDLIMENFSARSVFAFIKSPLLRLPFDAICDFEDYSLKYGIDDLYVFSNSNIEESEFYENFKLIRHFLFAVTQNFREEIKSATTVSDFILAFRNLFDLIKFDETISDFVSHFSKIGELKQMKIFEQYSGLLNDLLSSLDEVLGNEKVDFKLFMSTLLSGFETTKISTTPLSINAIFVGDASTSFFEECACGFVLGASEENFPKIILDCGIISDKDIEILSDKYKLEPSIAEINRKYRFKIFELLLKPKDKLFLSYNSSEGEKSSILSDIKDMLLVKDGNKFSPLKFKTIKDVDTLTLSNNLTTAKTNLVRSLRLYGDGQRNLTSFDSTLFDLLEGKLDSSFLNRFNYKNTCRLKLHPFFNKNSVSVSQVETFMTCPFLHFVKYGLRLAEKDEGQFNGLNIGLILHNFAQVLLKENTLPKPEKELRLIAKNTFDKILDEKEFYSVKTNTANAILLKNLKKESIRFALALNEQSKYSSFTPTYFEVRFDKKSKIKSLQIRHGNSLLSLVGQVDRIDIFQNFFRIIDYKTGSSKASLEELYFGKKVQLQAYMKVCEKSLKLRPAGAYYLPIKSTFTTAKSPKKESYKLKGTTLCDLGVIYASDSRLRKKAQSSDIVEVKFNSGGNDITHLSRRSKTATAEFLERIGSYAIGLIERACRDIENLDITPCPLVLKTDDPCINCKYASLCRFDTTLGNYKREIRKKVGKEKFDEIGGEAK